MGTGQTSTCCRVDPCGDSVAVDLDLPGHHWQRPRKWWVLPLFFASQSFSICANSTVVPRYAVAAILLIAALLKLDALRLDLSLRGERLWADWWTLLVIEWEFLLGTALLLGIALRTTWVVVLSTFVCFLAYAFWLIVTGTSNSGSLRPLEFHPRWTALLDAVVLVAAFRLIRIADAHPDRSVGVTLASAKLTRRSYGVIGLIALGILGYLAIESPLSVEAGQVPGIIQIRPDVEFNRNRTNAGARLAGYNLGIAVIRWGN